MSVGEGDISRNFASAWSTGRFVSDAEERQDQECRRACRGKKTSRGPSLPLSIPLFKLNWRIRGFSAVPIPRSGDQYAFSTGLARTRSLSHHQQPEVNYLPRFGPN